MLKVDLNKKHHLAKPTCKLTLMTKVIHCNSIYYVLAMCACICCNLMINGIHVGAVEFMISPHDVSEVCISFAFQFL